MGFLHPDNTAHAWRRDIASGYFKFSISNYFISLKNWFQHLGYVCSPDTQHRLCLQSKIRAATTWGPQCLMCGHSCISRSAPNLLKLEHKSPPSQDTLQGARVPQRETRSSFLIKEDFEKLPALCYTSVSKAGSQRQWLNKSRSLFSHGIERDDARLSSPIILNLKFV